MTQAVQPTEIDPNNPFTRDLIRNLVGTVRAQADETDAEYAERFAAVTTAWAAFHPRDTLEQMLAAHIVGAHHAGLDCLSRAMSVQDSALADRLRRSYATMVRSMRDTMRLLDRQQQSPAVVAPPVMAIAPIPQPRRQPPEAKPAQHPMHPEKVRIKAEPPNKDPAKMSDEELAVALTEVRTIAVAALFDKQHPLHRETLRILPKILPGIEVPDSYFGDTPSIAA